MLASLKYEQQYEQIELFPMATKAEIIKAKDLLEEYEECLSLRSGFEEEPLEELCETEIASYQKCIKKMKQIERAVRIIRDHEVREIVDFRYIKCNTYSETIREFTQKMDDRTVERKLNKGIVSVANSLKRF